MVYCYHLVNDMTISPAKSDHNMYVIMYLCNYVVVYFNAES